jgi:hypothetical protein
VDLTYIFVINVKSCYGGTGKGFLDFLTLVEEGQRQEVSVFAPEQKGKRELKNLECSINFDARGVGSSRIKGKRALARCVV